MGFVLQTGHGARVAVSSASKACTFCLLCDLPAKARGSFDVGIGNPGARWNLAQDHASRAVASFRRDYFDPRIDSTVR